MRLHEVAVAVHTDGQGTDWHEVQRRWRHASGIAGRDAALAAMPVTPIDLDDLPDTDLSPFAGVILAGRSDQQLLAAIRERIRAFLDQGRVVVVFSGQLTHDWLPGAAPFQRHKGDDEAAHSRPPRLEPHAVFDGVTAWEVGAAFLYRHGWPKPPQGAEVLLAAPDGAAVAYLDQRGTPGSLFVTTVDPLAHFGTTGAADAARFLDAFLPWVVHTLLPRGDPREH